jgi:hypothetical protein
MPPPGCSIYKLPRIGYSRLKETGGNGIAGAANHFLEQDTPICERTAIRLNQSRFVFSTEVQEMPQDTVPARWVMQLYGDRTRPTQDDEQDPAQERLSLEPKEQLLRLRRKDRLSSRKDLSCSAYLLIAGLDAG